MKKIYRVLSLGWGQQSYTLLVMSIYGDIEPFDYIVWADTGHESKITYEFINKNIGWINDKIKNYYVVGDVENNQIIRGDQIILPLHIKGGGILDRRCTGEWKIKPIRRFISAVLGTANFDMVIGISMDESERVRGSTYVRTKNIYPLVDARMTRRDCVAYLQSKGLGVPSSSQCVFCPLKGSAQWANMNQEDCKKAIEVDKYIRKIRQGRELYLRRDCKPVSNSVQFTFNNWLSEDCTGMCGI